MTTDIDFAQFGLAPPAILAPHLAQAMKTLADAGYIAIPRVRLKVVTVTAQVQMPPDSEPPEKKQAYMGAVAKAMAEDLGRKIVTFQLCRVGMKETDSPSIKQYDMRALIVGPPLTAANRPAIITPNG